MCLCVERRSQSRQQSRQGTIDSETANTAAGKRGNKMAKKSNKVSAGSGVIETEAPAEIKGTGPVSSEIDRPQPDQKTLDAIAEIRTKVQATVGEVMLAMMNVARYRHQTLADMSHIVLEPLMRDRVAVAKAEKDETLAGLAIWASVSDEVDAKIVEQVRSGVFPVRLASEDWASGDTLWLLDVIAPNRKLATSVLANFRQIAKDRPVKIHPIVARSVDPEVLEKVKVKGAPADEHAGQ